MSQRVRIGLPIDSGTLLTAACVYTAVGAPEFSGVPFGMVAARFAATMPLAAAAWALALVGGLALLCLGFARNIEEGHGPSIGLTALAIAALIFFLRVSWQFPPHQTALARIATRGFCITFIVIYAAQLVMAGFAGLRRAHGPPATRRAWPSQDGRSSGTRSIGPGNKHREGRTRP